MTEKMIRDAYCRIRTIDQTIPDDVLDFMKNAALEKLNLQFGNRVVCTCGRWHDRMDRELNLCYECQKPLVIYYNGQ